MRPSIRLGRIAGIQVGANAGVLVIVAILVFGLAAVRFPAAHPGRGAVAYVVTAVIAALLFLASLLAHEIAHALVAIRNGVQVDSITLWLFGGVAQLRGEMRSPGAEFAVAVIGPVTSLVLGGFFGAVAVGLNAAGADGLVVSAAAYLALVNVLLAIFNIIPAAPLDGGRVLRAALWKARGDRYAASVTAARAGRVFGYTMIGLGLVLVLFLGGLGGLWWALIGWFLVHAATAEEHHARLSQRLAGVRVADVMSPQPVTADPEAIVTAFVDGVAMRERFSTYPLTDADGRLTGLVTLNRIRAVPWERRGSVRLRDIACPPDEVPTARPSEPVMDLLPRLAGCTDGRAVVVDDLGRAIGLVSPSDISRALALADLRGAGRYPVSGADLSIFTAGSDRR